MNANSYFVSFFGKPKITVLGAERKIKSKRVFALLASAQVQEKAVTRQEVLNFLWAQEEDLDESVYAGRLRVLLYSNKEYIDQFLNVDLATIKFKETTPKLGFLSDIQSFNALLDKGDTQNLKEAVELYKGEFMQGFKMTDASYEFEDLLLKQRAFWEHKVTQTLDKIVNNLLIGKRKADLAESLYYVQKNIDINPLRDEVQIQLAKIYCRNRQREQAIKQLENYINRLLKSLNLRAGRDVHELLQQLRTEQSQEKRDYKIPRLHNVSQFRLI